ncbi:MAG TPA: hypothetical protein VJJ46_13750, partial [Anaerolineales bacterium]|nr:hypothetical protein [Anaerolineales bacterium]
RRPGNRRLDHSPRVLPIIGLGRDVKDPPDAVHGRAETRRIEDIADYPLDGKVLYRKEGGSRPVQNPDAEAAPDELPADGGPNEASRARDQNQVRRGEAGG